MSKFLNSPTPDQLQQIYHFGWLLSPLLIIALGSYCLDSKNSFCFFPGMYTCIWHNSALCMCINIVHLIIMYVYRICYLRICSVYTSVYYSILYTHYTIYIMYTCCVLYINAYCPYIQSDRFYVITTIHTLYVIHTLLQF